MYCKSWVDHRIMNTWFFIDKSLLASITGSKALVIYFFSTYSLCQIVWENGVFHSIKCLNALVSAYVYIIKSFFPYSKNTFKIVI